MRIFQLILAPRLSGAEMVVKGIAIDHQQSGHSVCIASLLPAQGDFALAAGELAAHRVTCVFPAHRYEKLGRLLFLYRAIRRFKPDVIFAHATIPALYVRALPVRVPIVWVMHSGVNDFQDNRLLRAERILSLRAKAVIGVSQKNVDEYVNAIGLHPSLVVVPNGVDTARFRHVAGMSRARRIVQIGRYTEEKNQLATLRAFRYVLEHEHEPEARLLFCGVVDDRAYHATLRALTNELGLVSRVDIQGPQANVAEILAASSVFAMPSSFEAHSVGFLEALASGIPIVANAIAAFSFARTFASVRLIDTSDIERYGRALSSAFSEPRAQRPLDGLTLEDTAERYLAIARQVIG
ncbi:glycosyltransferase family 4 protein [Trinickia fusca]|uniref:Glycosyltransferase n=1 Tax=Trinickia fusca TaxID=2419777 RepID=A0A494XS28_9BURK|nr:glycosyltransferase family 4 protein [Trinickia fusca]RKP50899.1 glycosyltransferase [Trinickia fusca]